MAIFRGLEHPHLPRALKQVADAYRRLYMVDKSYKGARKFSRKSGPRGQQHSKLGDLCIESYAEAILLFEKLGTHHFDDDYAACLQSIAAVYEDRMEWRAAVPWRERLVDTCTLVQGEKHADTKKAWSGLAKAKVQAKKMPKTNLLGNAKEVDPDS